MSHRKKPNNVLTDEVVDDEPAILRRIDVVTVFLCTPRRRREGTVDNVMVIAVVKANLICLQVVAGRRMADEKNNGSMRILFEPLFSRISIIFMHHHRYFTF